MELRSISEEERVKSGLTRAKLGGLSKAEIMEMVNILNIFVNVLINIAFLIILIKRANLGELSKAEIMEMVNIVIHTVAKLSKIIQSTKSRRQLKMVIAVAMLFTVLHILVHILYISNQMWLSTSSQAPSYARRLQSETITHSLAR